MIPYRLPQVIRIDDSPVLDVDISTILHGRAFNITKPFLRNAEHCMGKVADAPASPVSKCVSSISVAIVDQFVSVRGRRMYKN